ncbi:MAG TPA: SufE family protein [Bacteroidales bacterium]|nr:SufE family protein [Bacteroidales bacterium]HRZ47957.1 SufE family protein [Bacteroidales bacterium]
MATLKQKAEEIQEEFAMFDDWMDKYNYLIELGKTVPVIDEKYRQKQYLISGCQSQVWLHAALENGKIIFRADSDALITKGIVHLLIRVLSEESPEAILDADLGFLDEIGLKEHLSPTRANGLASMVKQMKLYALAFKAKQSQS